MTKAIEIGLIHFWQINQLPTAHFIKPDTLKKQTLRTKAARSDHVAEFIIKVIAVKIDDILIFFRLKPAKLTDVLITFENALRDWQEFLIFLASGEMSPAN